MRVYCVKLLKISSRLPPVVCKLVIFRFCSAAISKTCFLIASISADFNIHWPSWLFSRKLTPGSLCSHSGSSDSSKPTLSTFCPPAFFRFSSLSSATRLPLLMMATRSQMASTSCMMWVLSITVFSLPNCLISSLISTS